MVFLYHVALRTHGDGQHGNVYSLFREVVAGNAAFSCTGENYLDSGILQVNTLVYFTVFAFIISTTILFLFKCTVGNIWIKYAP